MSCLQGQGNIAGDQIHLSGVRRPRGCQTFEPWAVVRFAAHAAHLLRLVAQKHPTSLATTPQVCFGGRCTCLHWPGDWSLPELCRLSRSPRRRKEKAEAGPCSWLCRERDMSNFMVSTVAVPKNHRHVERAYLEGISLLSSFSAFSNTDHPVPPLSGPFVQVATSHADIAPL